MIAINKNVLQIIVSVVFLMGAVACGSKAENKEQKEKIEVKVEVPNPIINPDSCLSILLLNGEEKVALSEDDRRIVLSFLNSAMYNKERNENGIRFKMISPDYSFLIELKGEKKEFVQIWISESLLLHEAKWYNILSQYAIEPILEKYKKEIIE